jgi:ABC transporter substrate binding protein
MALTILTGIIGAVSRSEIDTRKLNARPWPSFLCNESYSHDHACQIAGTLLGGVGAWPLAVGAQDARKPAVPIVGLLGPESPARSNANSFREGLQELSYVVGQNIHIEYRWGNGAFDRLSDFAAGLVASDVDVIVANLTQATLVEKKATAKIPIVMVGVADLVGIGVIASEAGPRAWSQYCEGQALPPPDAV